MYEANADMRWVNWAEFEETKQGNRARRWRNVLYVISLFLVGAAVVFAFLGPLLFTWPARVTFAISACAAVVAGVMWVTAYIQYRFSYDSFVPKATIDAREREEQEQKALLRDTELSALLKYNRDMMMQYHQIATDQARVAGRNSQWAIIVGFASLIAGGVAAILVPDSVARVTVASLAALGGVFSAYMTKTFFQRHDASISTLDIYWRQPLATSYLLAAERVAGTLTGNGQDARDVELKILINKILDLPLLAVGVAPDIRDLTSRSTAENGTSVTPSTNAEGSAP